MRGWMSDPWGWAGLGRRDDCNLVSSLCSLLAVTVIAAGVGLANRVGWGVLARGTVEVQLELELELVVGCWLLVVGCWLLAVGCGEARRGWGVDAGRKEKEQRMWL